MKQLRATREDPGLSFHGEIRRSRLREALVLLIALKIAGLILVIDPWSIQSSDLPKTIFSRALAWVMFGVIAALLLRYGPGVIPRSPVHLAVLVLLAANAFSAMFAENKVLALYGDFPRFLGLGFVADMAVLYLAVAIGFRTPRDWGVVTGAVLGAFVVSAAYAAAQAAGADPILWTEDPLTRPFSTFGEPDAYGHFLSVVLGTCLGVVALGRVLPRAVSAVCMALALAVAAVVATRGTALGLTAGVLVVLPLLAVARGGRSLIVGLLVAAAFALSSFVLLADSPLASRASVLLSGEEIQGRLALYDVSVRAWRERPILGFGPDNFGPAFVGNHTSEHSAPLGQLYRQTSAHNAPLQAAVTIGALGLAALLGVIGVGTIRLLRALPISPVIAGALIVGSAAYWAHALVSPGAIGIDWFPWATWGAAAALLPAVPPRPSPWLLPTRIALAMGATVIVLSSVMGGLTATKSAHASHAAWEARDATGERAGFRAIAAARTAVDREPLRADHWNWLGLGLDIHARWQDAAAAFLRAGDLAPHEIQYRVNAARAYARLAIRTRSPADFDRSRAALEAARATDPHDPLSYQVQAEVELAAGRLDAALAFATVAHTLETRADAVTLIRLIMRTAPPTETSLLMVTEALRRRETGALHVVAAEMALGLERVDDARRHALRALELEPSRVDAQRLVDQLR